MTNTPTPAVSAPMAERAGEPLWSDERIADAATKAWNCYDFKLGARIEMKMMRNEYEAVIDTLRAQLAQRGEWELVPDGPLCAWAELDNRTIFIRDTMIGGRKLGYTLRDDEYLIRRKPQEREVQP